MAMRSSLEGEGKLLRVGVEKLTEDVIQPGALGVPVLGAGAYRAGFEINVTDGEVTRILNPKPFMAKPDGMGGCIFKLEQFVLDHVGD